jgi:hypothetical protein
MAEAYLSRLDPEGKRFTTSAVAAWRTAAGPEVDKHTTGVALRSGELLVYVDSAVWASELSIMAEQYRVRVNEEIGEELVRSVRFTVSRKVQEEKRREHAERRLAEPDRGPETKPLPLDDQERAQVESMAAAIHDPDVRDAAVRAMVRHLEWKKGNRSQNGPHTPPE